MKRFAIYFLTMVATFSVALIFYAIKPKPLKLSPEMREAEEFAVYSALINSFHPQFDGKVLLIQSRTEPFYFYDGVGDETKFIKDNLPPATSTDTLGDYKAVDPQAKELSRRFVLNDSYVLLTKEERHQSFATLNSMREFHRDYPNSSGIRLLSRVGFNRSFDEALVYSWGYCGGDCGGGGYYLLRKEHGIWKLKQEKTWIS